MKSMGFIDLKRDRLNQVESQPNAVDTFSKLNVHKKQDKSKIHKYSPFHIKEQRMNEKYRVKDRSIGKRISGSNSFIGGSNFQTAQYKVKKAKNESRQKKESSLSSSLRLIAQKSISRESAEQDLQPVGENIDEENSEEKMPHPETQRSSEVKSSQNKENEFLSSLDREMELSSRDREQVLVLNTPSKSEIYSQGNNNEEIDF